MISQRMIVIPAREEVYARFDDCSSYGWLEKALNARVNVKTTFKDDKVIRLRNTGQGHKNDTAVIKCTVHNLITVHVLIRAQSRDFIVFRLQPVYFVYFFIKASFLVLIWIALTCQDNSNEYQKTYTFIKKIEIKGQI